MNLEQARLILIDHSRTSLNGKFPPEAQLKSQMTNPICGDHVEIRIQVIDQKIAEIGFLTKACAICSASTSLMSQTLRAYSIEKALEVSRVFEQSILDSPSKEWPGDVKALQCFEHLKVNPSRRACAILPWIVLRVALNPLGAESRQLDRDKPVVSI